jgi:hypothetical protein
MSTFDTILPEIEKVLSSHKAALTAIGELIINRDLNGRVRLIAHASIENKPETQLLASAISAVLGNHGFSTEKMFLFENDLEKLRLGVPCYQPFIGNKRRSRAIYGNSHLCLASRATGQESHGAGLGFRVSRTFERASL